MEISTLRSPPGRSNSSKILLALAKMLGDSSGSNDDDDVPEESMSFSMPTQSRSSMDDDSMDGIVVGFVGGFFAMVLFLTSARSNASGFRFAFI